MLHLGQWWKPPPTFSPQASQGLDKSTLSIRLETLGFYVDIKQMFKQHSGTVDSTVKIKLRCVECRPFHNLVRKKKHLLNLIFSVPGLSSVFRAQVVLQHFVMFKR
jgi:hypothetical protein